MKTISTTYCRRFDNSCYHHQCISGFIVLFLKICSTILGTTIPKKYKILGLLAEDTIKVFRFFIECTIGCKSAFTTNPTLCAHFAFAPVSIQQQCYAGMRQQCYAGMQQQCYAGMRQQCYAGMRQQCYAGMRQQCYAGMRQQCYAGMRLQFNFLAFCCFLTERKQT